MVKIHYMKVEDVDEVARMVALITMLTKRKGTEKLNSTC